MPSAYIAINPSINLSQMTIVPKKILVIKLRLIGDLIISVPAYRTIKENFPDTHLSVIVEKGFEAVLENNPHVDKIIVFDKTKGFFHLVSLILNLRKEAYDWVIDFHGGPTSGLLTLFSGGKLTVGYGKRKFYYQKHIHFLRKGLNARQFYLKVLQELGLTINKENTELFVAEETTKNIRKKLFEKGISGSFILIHAAVKKRSEEWQPEKYAELIKRIETELKVAVVLSCGPSQENQLKNIELLLDTPPVMFKGELHLREFIALVEESKALISYDSSPVHIAAAFEKPVVALYGTISPENWGYQYENYCSVFVPDLECRSTCFQNKLPECHQGLSLCMTSITVEEVFNHVKKMVS
ncbi:MAG: glycosyltransferase family 9 protein [Nitrospinae bacterium]|nr:glycosyltransferase family 9 protein [Nitrospinota bacterium]